MSSKDPICVDLDGTLILTDTMMEALLDLLKKRPYLALQVALWLRYGKGVGKHEIAIRASLLADELPYNEELITWLKQQKNAGRKLYLATGTNIKFAEMVADHVGIFDDVIASTKDRSMSGTDKAEALIERFGERNFAYAGNSLIDLSVWKHASECIIVNAAPSLAAAARKIGSVTTVIHERKKSFKVFLRALRWHQWAKNILIFVPLFTAHQLANAPLTWNTFAAFISFSAIASAVYLMNDLTDLSADRKNRFKKNRPLASGSMTITTALVSGIILIWFSLLLALFLPPTFMWVLLIYAVVNIFYSFRLKQVVGMDVFIITSLYVLRVFAGSAATGIATSIWLFIFAALIFLSLALVKRVSEIVNLESLGESETTGRGYKVSHRKMLTSVGHISGYASLIVLIFYIQSPIVASLYKIPTLLWLLLPLFGIWIHRVWSITQKGNMHEDPTVYAAKDWFSYTTALIAIVIVMLAT